MTEKIESALSAVVGIVATVTGIQQVPVNPPDTISAATVALVYAQSGVIDNGVVGTKKALHIFAVDVLTQRTELARDLARVKPFLDTVPAALLADPTFGGTVLTFESIVYQMIMPEYAGVPMIGYQFSINGIKIFA